MGKTEGRDLGAYDVVVIGGAAAGLSGALTLSVHQALLFRQLSADVTFFSHTMPHPTDEQAEQLAACGIGVVDGRVASSEVVEDRLAGVRVGDGRVVGREALAVSPRMTARYGFLANLGVQAVEHPAGVGEYSPSDATGRTDVPGVWVAGNVTDLAAHVGAAAAAQINADLVVEETRRAKEA